MTKRAAIDYSPHGLENITEALGAMDTQKGAIEQFSLNAEAKPLNYFGKFAKMEEVAQATLWQVSDDS